MRKLAFAVVIAVGCLAVEPASAATSPYVIHGSSCTSMWRPISERGLAVVALPHVSQYGVNADIWAIDVTCPIVLPWMDYKSVYLGIQGYNRSSKDPLSCRITSTDGSGLYVNYEQAVLQSDSPVSQSVSTQRMNLVAGASVYVTCHLPAQTPSGASHLSLLFLVLSDDAILPRRGQTPVSPQPPTRIPAPAVSQQ